MKRHKNVDLLRAAAILIIIYHSYILGGAPLSGHTKINALLSFGGEVGVTLFFILSGFGIFCSLFSREQRQKFPKWSTFMRQRCVRIMPQYYFCLMMLLIFQSSALIGRQGVKHILAYSLFGQNLMISTHGSINGALWAMATIFQFYLIAIPLYRFVERNWLVAGISAVVITIFSKFIIYHILLKNANLGGAAYFVYGRQLVSALDNFVLGMLAAKLSQNVVEKRNGRILWSGIIGVLISLGMLVGVSYWFSINGLYVDAFRGYVGHTILALILTGVIILFAVLPECKSGIGKPFLWIAKYQYGMYLWHMPIIACLYNGSPAFQYLASHNFVIFALSIILVVMVVGYFISKSVDSIDYSMILRRKSI